MIVSASITSAELLSDPQFLLLKDWVIQRTGLSYYATRDSDFALAVERVFGRDNSPHSAHSLLSRIQSNAYDLDALVEGLTIGETFFFRHLEMFQALRKSVFPDLLQRKAGTKTLRIWSAGCSIGAEPYSIAILLRELLGNQFKDWSIHILGTDINRHFLRVAKEAAYDPWTLRGMPPHVLHHCFIKDGKKWRLTERCRAGVSFRNHNLASDTFPNAAEDLAAFDLIICRNVMIYFDQAFIQKLARQFYDTLTPGGWLAVGHAEPHTQTFRMFRTVNTTGAVLYQRPTSTEESHEPIHWPDFALPASRALHHPSWSPPSLRLDLPTSVQQPTQPLAIPSPSQADRSQADPLAEIIRLADLGAHREALQACDEVLLREPLSAPAHCFHGMILYQLGEWAAAERSVRRSLYLNRDLALGHYYLGLIHERQGLNAQRHFNNARELLAGRAEEDLVPLGQGLTVREFRSLLMVPGALMEAQ